MPEVVETPVPEVIAPSSPPPQRFEIPSFTDKAAAEPIVKTPKADSPPATEEKPPEEVKDPEAEKRAQRQRTNRLFKQLAEEKVRREFAEKELEKVRKPAEPVRSGAPDPAQFTDIAEYTKAVREHERTEAVKEYEQQKQLKQSQDQQNQLVEQWNSAIDKAGEKYEDFEQVVGELKPTTPWAIAIMQSENAADIAYHLGQNLKEAQRIIALNPVSQIYEIGKLSAKLLTTPPAPKPASKAPAPITPVAGTAQPEATLQDGMEFEKFRKLRNKQLGR